MTPKRPTRRRTAKQVEKDLQAIYQEDGRMPDLKRLESHSSSALTRFLVRTVLVLLVLSAAAWAGFWVWRPFSAPERKPLVASFEGPAEVNSMQEASYMIRYENTTRRTIGAAVIELHLPEDFLLEKAEPAATEKQIWRLGALDGRAKGEIKLMGRFRGAVGTEEHMQAIVSYQPSGTSSEFQEVINTKTVIKGSFLALAMTGPEKTIPGDDVTYTLTALHSGPEALQNVRIRAALPESFRVSSLTPDGTQPSVAVWDIPSIEPGATLTYTIFGRYAAVEAGMVEVKAQAGLMGDAQTFLSQGEAVAKTEILGGQLQLHLVGNGNSERTTVAPGGELKLSFDYANKGQERMEEVMLVIEFIAPDAERVLPFLWSKSQLDGARRTKSVLTWDKANLPALAAINPNDAGVLDVIIKLSDDFSPPVPADQLLVAAKATVRKVGSVETPRTIEAVPLQVSVVSDTKLRSSVRYFDEEGTPVGTGALPPKVGQFTSYRVYWSVSNSLHELQDLAVKTTLPADVGWANKQNADLGAVVYDAASREVRWSVQSMTLDKPTATAWFDVMITPAAGDAGSFFDLTGPVTLQATDKSNNAGLSASSGALTTEAPDDPTAAGKGVVEP